VSALSAPANCRAKFVLDDKVLARLGAVGLSWSDDKGFTLASDRSTLQNRPWSAAPPLEVEDDRVVRPGHATSHGADPADPAIEPDGPR
jgi:competence protein ComEC